MKCLYERLKNVNIFFITNGIPGISLNMVNKKKELFVKFGILLDLTKFSFK